MTDSSSTRQPALSGADIGRLFTEATASLAFEATMRGVELIGMDAQLRLIVLHPDGTTSPFQGETRTQWKTKRR
jgi:hypothetical protein